MLQSGLVCGVVREVREGSLGCWRKCLNFMKTGLRWTNQHVGVLTNEDSLCIVGQKLLFQFSFQTLPCLHLWPTSVQVLLGPCSPPQLRITR